MSEGFGYRRVIRALRLMKEAGCTSETGWVQLKKADKKRVVRTVFHVKQEKADE